MVYTQEKFNLNLQQINRIMGNKTDNTNTDNEVNEDYSKQTLPAEASETASKNPKHRFKVSSEKHPSFVGTKIATALESAVNLNDKHNDVVPIDLDYQDLFAVRAGVENLYNELAKEEQEDIVSHYDFIELVSDDTDKKKVRFAIWKRIKASKILR